MMVVNDDESWPRKRSTVAAVPGVGGGDRPRGRRAAAIIVRLPDVALTHRTVVAARRSCLLPLVRTFHSRGFDQRKKEHRVPIFISHSIHLFSSNYSCLSVCGGKYGSICTRGRSKVSILVCLVLSFSKADSVSFFNAQTKTMLYVQIDNVVMTWTHLAHSFIVELLLFPDPARVASSKYYAFSIFAPICNISDVKLFAD